MTARTCSVGAAGFLMLTACSFDTSPSSGNTAGLAETDSEAGETSASQSGSDGTSTSGATASGSSPSTDPSAPSDPTTDPSDPSDPTTDPSDPTTDTDASGPTTDSDGAAPAMVELEGNNFGNVDYQGNPTRDYTLTNVGEVATENLAIVVSGPFALDTTNCPGSLGPGESCIETVSHSADTLGPFSGKLLVGYDNTDGLQEISRDLSAEVVGETGNLIPDPSFEGCALGASPAGWQVFAGPDWECGDWVPAQGGGQQFLAPQESTDNNSNIGLFVDLSPYAHAISTGSMSFELRGYGRSFELNNDLYRLRIRYRNAGGQVQAGFDPDFATASAWTLYTDTRDVPADVEEARIDFYCQKSSGDFCDGYLDTLSLVGRYQP